MSPDRKRDGEPSRPRRRGGRARALESARKARAPAPPEAEAAFDRTLTEQGLGALGEGAPPAPDPALAERLCVIACGALAREILALKALNGWDTLDLACLPALLHNRPALIADRLRAAIRAARARGYGRVFVGYGDCGTGGAIDAVCAETGAERLPGAHCYAFFTGVAAFERAAERDVTSFFLTDFLARQFDAIVWRGLGLDRFPELRDQYFGNYERVVFLAQTDDPALDAAARDAAARLGLAYERRPTGYGDLASALGGALAEPRD